MRITRTALILGLSLATTTLAQPVALQNQLYRIEVAPAAIVVTRLVSQNERSRG